ncbi:phosphatase PAP2 family protein [Flavobacteriaceae bacterium F89]|uniref:Phosphatase PAP2 family protein n=1 Tax=Cerina litoralis TaxID=2874477 RepID=A0AAE3EW37_9FLAO|nr:phosphatase PAP2 family protein [Cerina litoralis]MCG2460762.1 phosphatase PAP2 family protein [Cerina litoralis]
MLESIVQHDRELFLFLNNLGNPTWDSFWLVITNKWSSIPLYAVLLFLAYKNLGARKTVILVLTVVVMITVTDQLANFFKYGVQRLRPCHNPDVYPYMRLVKDYCGGQFGYFSAHAANSMAVAFVFTYILREKYRFIGPLLVLWAVLVGYSRIYIGVHYPMDVVTGMFFGLVFGWIFVKLFIFAQQKYQL